MQKEISSRLPVRFPLFNLIGFLVLVVYAGTFFFPLMDKDAAHHANIALRMYEHNDFINLIDREKDYLDKPHLLFWASAVSFEIFGVNTFAHRFPAFLFSLLTLYSVYRLSLHLSGRSIAKIAVMMLATAQAFMFSISDARMEAPLSAFIALALWQLIVYTDSGRTSNIILGAIGCALAFSTKGWIGPVVIFTGMFFYILLQGKWNVLLKTRTWLFIPVFFIFITPVLYAYYLQFDLHPEKIIRGKSGRSGLAFILWNQLFERSQGFDQGHSGRNSDYFFLFHTFLWAFFPWSIIAYGALVFWARRIFQRKFKSSAAFAAASFAFLLFAISFSKFKMPHYIVMLLPYASLFTAPLVFLFLKNKKGPGLYFIFQVIFAVLILGIIAAGIYFFPPVSILPVATTILLILFFGYLVFSFKNKGYAFYYLGISMALTLNFFLFYYFFPAVMKYQGGNELVHQLAKKNILIRDEDILLVELHAHSFDFYRRHNHRILEAESFPEKFDADSNKYFLLSSFLADHLRKNGFAIHPVAAQPDYNVATINLKFLNPVTRSGTMDTLMLAKISRSVP